MVDLVKFILAINLISVPVGSIVFECDWVLAVVIDIHQSKNFDSGSLLLIGEPTHLSSSLSLRANALQNTENNQIVQNDLDQVHTDLHDGRNDANSVINNEIVENDLQNRQNIDHDNANNEIVENDLQNRQNIDHDNANNEIVENDLQNRQNIDHDDANNEIVENDLQNRQNIDHDDANNEIVENDLRNRQNIDHNDANNENERDENRPFSHEVDGIQVGDNIDRSNPRVWTHLHGAVYIKQAKLRRLCLDGKAEKRNLARSVSRQLMNMLVPRDVLAVHSLSGKSSPAFPDKPPLPRIDSRITEAIFQYIKKEIMPNAVRADCNAGITGICADAAKTCRRRRNRNAN
ncbi:GATA zinc finger domain-containing protein 14-like [Aphidius gifuensis]|uniref:GATA zinc finger domain-containing protein 14-like n=1 Tax=Aphidius gifuensis TaxID=684658 RepID=UPI001CDC019B|nr:GATA zinc finger domain-containing protein 14-like [Aphidius gifuensis]